MPKFKNAGATVELLPTFTTKPTNCSDCGAALEQPKTGRPRTRCTTCSPREPVRQRPTCTGCDAPMPSGTRRSFCDTCQRERARSRYQPVDRPDACVRCGTGLTQPPRSRRVYCDNCQKEVQREHVRNSKARARGLDPSHYRSGDVVSCQDCGTAIPYAGVGGRPKRCETCRKAYERAGTNAWRRRRATQAQASSPRYCADCNAQLSPKQRKYCESCSDNHVSPAQKAAIRAYRERRKSGQVGLVLRAS